MRIVKKCDLGEQLLFQKEDIPFELAPLRVNYNPYGLDYADLIRNMYPGLDEEYYREPVGYYETAKAARRRQEREKRKAEEQRGAEAARKGMNDAGQKMYEAGRAVGRFVPVVGDIIDLTEAAVEAGQTGDITPVVKEAGQQGVSKVVRRIPKVGKTLSTIIDIVDAAQ